MSWELDALDPATLDTLVEEEILAWRSEPLWDEAVVRQNRQRRRLAAVRDRWDDVVALVESDE
jgi:hypothetical protein